MKTSKILVIAIAFILALPLHAEKIKVDVEKSSLEWVGKKVTGQHNGYIDLKSAELEIKNNKVATGIFVIDMPSMSNVDLEAGGMRDKLMGHLKSDDFFGVDKFPEAKLVVTSSSKFTDNKAKVKGDLTIKGKTHPISFIVEKVGKDFKTVITVDRTKYDVRYGSGKFFDNLGDKTIYDDFTLNVILKSK